MKTFIDELRNELSKRGLSQIDIEDIIHDHEELIESGKNEGLSDDELLKRLGDPKTIAEEIASFSSTEENENETHGRHLYQHFLLSSSDLSIEISLVNDDFEVIKSEDNQLELWCDDLESIHRYDCHYEVGRLVLKAPKERLSFFHRTDMNSKSFLLKIPKNASIGSFKFQTVSGDFTYQSNDIKDFHLATTSGDVTIKNCRIDSSKWNTVSGDISIIHVQMGQLQSSQVSGDMHMKSSAVDGDCTLNTVSGDLILSDCTCNECFFQSVSGDIKGEEFYPKKMSMKSVSGDIVIRNKEKKTFEILSKSSLSGDIRIE